MHKLVLRIKKNNPEESKVGGFIREGFLMTKARDLTELCNQIGMFTTQKHKHFTMVAE